MQTLQNLDYVIKSFVIKAFLSFILYLGKDRESVRSSSASRKLRNLYLNGHEGCLKMIFSFFRLILHYLWETVLLIYSILSINRNHHLLSQESLCLRKHTVKPLYQTSLFNRLLVTFKCSTTTV